MASSGFLPKGLAALEAGRPRDVFNDFPINHFIDNGKVRDITKKFNKIASRIKEDKNVDRGLKEIFEEIFEIAVEFLLRKGRNIKARLVCEYDWLEIKNKKINLSAPDVIANIIFSFVDKIYLACSKMNDPLASLYFDKAYQEYSKNPLEVVEPLLEKEKNFVVLLKDRKKEENFFLLLEEREGTNTFQFLKKLSSHVRKTLVLEYNERLPPGIQKLKNEEIILDEIKKSKNMEIIQDLQSAQLRVQSQGLSGGFLSKLLQYAINLASYYYLYITKGLGPFSVIDVPLIDVVEGGALTFTPVSEWKFALPPVSQSGRMFQAVKQETKISNETHKVDFRL